MFNCLPEIPLYPCGEPGLVGDMVIDRRFTKQAGAVTAIAFILVMAGCLAGSDGEPAAGENPQGGHYGQEHTELEAQEETEPEPVEIREDGMITGSFSRNWDWDVAPGWKKIQIELTMTLTPSSNPASFTDLSLRGGDGLHCWTGTNGGITANIAPNQKFLEVDGNQVSSSANLSCQTNGSVAGPWSLSVDLGPNVTDYSFVVIVDY